ncbi:NrsF family protein [Sphingopyxis sp.]|uniref:NrsF family protein n=1 Tax=Sphingopyxis sp. TaxID=1908224 RepID=UPI003D0BE52E
MTDLSIDHLIDDLASELEPVRPRRVARGSLWVVGGWTVGATLLLWLSGMRHDLAAGAMMPPLPLLAFWLIVALGVATAWSALRMGLPGVGRDYSGWRWAGLAALALPFSALVMGFGDHHAAMEAARPENGLRCMIEGVLAGLGVGAALFAWLKRGAPTSPTRAGWVIGIAAGAAGATIVALHCASNDMMHIALWHGLAVALSGVAGRLLLAPLLRW